jgi:hypothetical protein
VGAVGLGRRGVVIRGCVDGLPLPLLVVVGCGLWDVGCGLWVVGCGTVGYWEMRCDVIAV